MALRTPDEHFENLPGFPFQPNYLNIPHGGESLRVHYVDEGPRDGKVVLLLHGEPTWSYLYRKMIPILTEAGFRAIAPDLIGFGRSDKLPEITDYSYQSHMDWLTATVKALEINEIHLICQDWGSLLGLRLVGEKPELFAKVLVANGGLPTGKETLGEAFEQWQKYAREVPELPVGKIVARGCLTRLSKEEIAAYDKPYPDESYKAGARAFPTLVPTSPEDPAAPANLEAWRGLRKFTKPLLTAFADKDPMFSGQEVVFHKLVPGAKDQAHTVIEGANHFIQEDRGEALAEVAVSFFN